MTAPAYGAVAHSATALPDPQVCAIRESNSTIICWGGFTGTPIQGAAVSVTVQSSHICAIMQNGALQVSGFARSTEWTLRAALHTTRSP